MPRRNPGSGANPDHHQQTQLGLLQADLEVDAVDPQVDVVGAGQIAAPGRGSLVLPLRRAPGNCSRAGANLQPPPTLIAWVPTPSPLRRHQ